MFPEQFKKHSIVSQSLNDGLNPFVLPVKPVPKSSEQHFLDMIFTCKDGDISGDLALFLGDNANPEVVQFIQSNLLQPQSAIGYSDLSDVEQLNLMRRFGESEEDYVLRLKSVLNPPKSD